MNCYNCGAEINDNTLICQYCGAENEKLALDMHKDTIKQYEKMTRKLEKNMPTTMAKSASRIITYIAMGIAFFLILILVIGFMISQ